MNKVPEGQFGQTPKHCQCEEFWGWRSDKPQTSRSFKHELAYQRILTNLLFTIKTSIEIIRGRIHGEEGQ